MAETRRKTTIKERNEIIEYCINRNYKETASIYDVKGEEGLTDKRGHHKTYDGLDKLKGICKQKFLCYIRFPL